MPRTPEDVYISFWRGEIDRLRQSARLFKASGDRSRRCYVAACRRLTLQALRAHGARYRVEEVEPCIS